MITTSNAGIYSHDYVIYDTFSSESLEPGDLVYLQTNTFIVYDIADVHLVQFALILENDDYMYDTILELILKDRAEYISIPTQGYGYPGPMWPWIEVETYNTTVYAFHIYKVNELEKTMKLAYFDIEAYGHEENFSIDVDGDGQATAMSDGVLMLRFLAGFNGQALISDFISENCTRCTSEEITSYLNEVLP
jgi:hypothetical protein